MDTDETRNRAALAFSAINDVPVSFAARFLALEERVQAVEEVVVKQALVLTRMKLALDPDHAELLAALRGMVELVDAFNWGEGPALRSARAIIAKAEPA